MRLMVATPTFDATESSATVIFKIALAALICSLVINAKYLYNDTYGIT
jgi:hypothetical protein